MSVLNGWTGCTAALIIGIRVESAAELGRSHAKPAFEAGAEIGKGTESDQFANVCNGVGTALQKLYCLVHAVIVGILHGTNAYKFGEQSA